MASKKPKLANSYNIKIKFVNDLQKQQFERFESFFF